MMKASSALLVERRRRFHHPVHHAPLRHPLARLIVYTFVIAALAAIILGIAAGVRMYQHLTAIKQRLDRVQEDFGAEVVAVGGREADTSRPSRVVDHVDHQAHEAINEILPRPRLPLQAALQQTPVNLRESHANRPLVIQQLPLAALLLKSI